MLWTTFVSVSTSLGKEKASQRQAWKYRGGNLKSKYFSSPGGLPGGPPGGVPRGRGSPGRFWGAVRASHLAKKSKDKTPGVFFHAAFDFDTPGP